MTRTVSDKIRPRRRRRKERGEAPPEESESEGGLGVESNGPISRAGQLVQLGMSQVLIRDT
eukprot:150430-Hanusia_phi.AAC.3